MHIHHYFTSNFVLGMSAYTSSTHYHYRNTNSQNVSMDYHEPSISIGLVQNILSAKSLQNGTLWWIYDDINYKALKSPWIHLFHPVPSCSPYISSSLLSRCTSKWCRKFPINNASINEAAQKIIMPPPSSNISSVASWAVSGVNASDSWEAAQVHFAKMGSDVGKNLTSSIVWWLP